MLPKKIGQYQMDFSRDPQGQRGDVPFNARAMRHECPSLFWKKPLLVSHQTSCRLGGGKLRAYLLDLRSLLFQAYGQYRDLSLLLRDG